MISNPLFINRDLSHKIKELFGEYPILTLLGPRQSGKSTLIKHIYPNLQYVNLEAPDERVIIENDPKSFLDNLSEQGVIIDEVQRYPELLSYLQVYVDNKDKNSQIILTGSHQLELHNAISQSLAGRTAIVKLLPLSFHELEKQNLNYDADDYILKGFYPKLYKQKIDATKYYQDYVNTYVERDVRKMINVKDLDLFQNFLQLTAGRIGQLINYSNLSNELGVAVNTIKQWFSILEASYVIFKIRPYYENIGKRLIKANKIYFTDTGLACYLLGIENKIQLQRDPLRGGLFENMVVAEIIKARYNLGKDHNLYFYRDSHQHEIDLIFKSANNLIPIEIKSSKTFNNEFLKNIIYFNKLLSDRIPMSYLIYGGDKNQKIQDNIKLLHYKNGLETIKQK